MTLADLASQAQTLQAKGKRIVHCHGVFDLLHLGHLRYFEAAKRHGDVLVVTITADEYVNKGPGRPVFTSDQRAEMLASLGIIDFVAVNHEKTAVSAIIAIRPDFYVKGSDYASDQLDITGNIAREKAALLEIGGQIGRASCRERV